jgi:ribosomal protein S18 acetylase RimI-like enzyme
MIEIKSLLSLNQAALLQVISGYTSPERYAVTLSESNATTTFQLSLEKLPRPYVKDFRAEFSNQDFERYQEILQEGLSLGAWQADQLVGVGIAGAEKWNRTLWIWEFHIQPAFRGLGIGRQLMNALADVGRSAEMRTMRVETQNTNVPAIRFYRSLGFHLEGIDVSFYSNDDLTSGEVALFLKRRLD